MPEPTVIRPQNDDDREYLKMMYEEQAEHARQHEELRGTATGLFMALIAGLLAFAVGEKDASRRELVAGLLICSVSVIGSIINHKHYERYQLHLTRLRGFRKSLESTLNGGVKDINDIWTKYHNDKYWLFCHISLHRLWVSIYIITFLIGIVLIFISILLSEPATRAPTS